MSNTTRRQFLAQSGSLLAFAAMSGSASSSAVAAMGPNDKFDLLIRART
jgi:hypothetical protein